MLKSDTNVGNWRSSPLEASGRPKQKRKKLGNLITKPLSFVGGFTAMTDLANYLIPKGKPAVKMLLRRSAQECRKLGKDGHMHTLRSLLSCLSAKDTHRRHRPMTLGRQAETDLWFSILKELGLHFMNT